MPGKKPQTRRRQALIALVIGGAISSILPSSMAIAEENVLVTAFAQDCCPPPAHSCGPTVDGYYDSQSAPLQAVPGEDGTISLAPTVGSASQPAISAPSDGSAQFDAPISQNTASNLPQASAFGGGAAASSLASNTGSQGGLDAPNMLGDFPGQRTTVSVVGSVYTVPTTGNRRFKITENVSPIPQDRLFFNYNGYDEALQANNDDFFALHRYSFGGEKTFADGLFSTELRMVVTDGLDATQTAARERGAEFGNLLFSVKSLLYSNDSLLVGGGLTFTIPTAQDVELVGVGTIENETVYLGPYLGFVETLSENWFLQGFMQTEFAAGGDSVLDSGGVEQGILNDQHFLYTSLSLGNWLYRDAGPSACVNGVASMLELHYSTTLNDADNLPFGGVATFNPSNLRSDYLNLTSGLVFVKGLSNLRIAGGTSLRDGDDDLYDAELTVQVNRFF